MRPAITRPSIARSSNAGEGPRDERQCHRIDTSWGPKEAGAMPRRR